MGRTFCLTLKHESHAIIECSMLCGAACIVASHCTASCTHSTADQRSYTGCYKLHPYTFLPASRMQSSTRYVSAARRKRLIMAPIYDMANHDRNCPHTINPYEDSMFLHIIAGRDVQPGEEVSGGMST